jgi:ubiquinone/menaquinone biosynthesis C-methylase UbiE
VDARRLIHKHVIPHGSKVIDLCCGVGFSSARHCDVTGVDTSEEMLAIARVRRRDVGHFVKGNAETYGEDLSCDVVRATPRAPRRPRASRTSQGVA